MQAGDKMESISKVKIRCGILLFVISLLLVTINTYAYNIGDDYPQWLKDADPDTIVDDWNFYNRECTSFCAWCLNNRNGVEFHNYYGGVRWGNGSNWKSAAEQLGIRCDNTPSVGAIACWTAGHVAWVEEVNESSVIIEEYNHAGNPYGYNRRDIAGDHPSCYIHIKDINPNPTDTQKPVITSATIVNRTSQGYDVVVTATDDTEIQAIQIGTWHSGMSVDNAVWQEEQVYDGKAIIHVNYSSFGYPSNVTYYTVSAK